MATGRSTRPKHDPICRRTAVKNNVTELEDRLQLDPVDLDTIRQQVTNLVANRALDVVHKMLDQIGQGNHQAMKYLFEMVGLFPASTTEDRSKEDSLAKTLSNYLDIPEGSSPSRGAAPHGRGQIVEADAVK